MSDNTKLNILIERPVLRNDAVSEMNIAFEIISTRSLDSQSRHSIYVLLLIVVVVCVEKSLMPQSKVTSIFFGDCKKMIC